MNALNNYFTLIFHIFRMHKTKEVRSACGTDINTPAEPVQQEEKHIKKNDLLLQVVKSNNFQKLLTARSKCCLVCTEILLS